MVESARSGGAMLLNLRTLQDASEHLETRYPPSRFPTDPASFRVIAPVALSVDVSKGDDRRYRLAGRVVTTLEMVCSRCLEPLPLPVDAAFDLEYLPRTENAGEGEREIAEDDLATAFYADETIDLGELMSEQFQLAVPMKPLCSEACRGLCPQCGTNLNVSACGCRQGWEDARLSALKSLVTPDRDA
jgi:uncharacterized metal-binding protein YceD (DUF177 family)